MRRAHRIGAAGGFGYTILTFAAWFCLERLGAGGPVSSWSAHHLSTFFTNHRAIERLSAMFFSSRSFLTSSSSGICASC
jgi:hypothetical protein